jgi:hypothetical protein
VKVLRVLDHNPNDVLLCRTVSYRTVSPLGHTLANADWLLILDFNYQMSGSLVGDAVSKLQPLTVRNT